jgi:enoyl-CoA hydratase/carnithine racemase
MPANPVLWNLDERGVATVTLNRPEVNNAYDAGLIHGVLAAMDDLGGNLRCASSSSKAMAGIFRPAPT